MLRWSVPGFLLMLGTTTCLPRGMSAQEVAPAVPVHPQTVAELLAASHQVEYTDAARASTLATQAVDAARQRHDARSELEALLQTGKTARFLNQYPRALATANEGLALAAKLNNEAMQGEFYLLRGYVKWNQADLPGAMANLLSAEKLSRSTANVPLQIAVQSTLGLVKARNGDAASSLPHLEAARALAEQAHDPQLSGVLNNLGSHYLGLQDYPQAREFFEQALPLARAAGNQRLTAFLLVNLGQVAVETNDEAKARDDLSEALAISERFHIRRGSADARYLLAGLERRLGHFDASRDQLDQSLAIARDLQNPDLFATIYTEYVATEAASGRYREALGYARQLAEQQEIIRGEKSRLRLAQLTAEYDAEARAQQIKILSRDRALDQVALALKNTEISRTHSRYSALALALVLLGLAASAFAGRQRSRARRASRALAETRAAKEQVEEADADKARLLAIAAQHLQESDARFRNAFDLSPLGMALVGLEGQWLRVNSALCHIMGYEENELLATDFQTITHPDDLTTDLEFVAQLLRGEIETYQMEKRYFHKNGVPVWIRLDVSLLREPGTQQPKCFISQVQDVTARRHQDELLHHAKEEAECANTAKSEFLSRMSHELRTPLNAILGFGQLLEISNLDAQASQSVSQILTASRHLLDLINEVLDISTIESGQFAFSLEPVLVHEVVRGVVGLVRPLSTEAGLSIIAAPSAGEDAILADPRRLRQVLLNLLANAIKYNRRGGAVTVTCRCVDERVRIEVADTGHGIAAADLETIFVPFARLAQTQSVVGTGLGLSLSKALTEAMRGVLGVDSEVGRGSTFWLEFARLPDGGQQVEPGLDFEALPVGFFEPVPTEDATLLYIEDDPANLELVQFILSKHRHLRVLPAPDGRTGLEMAARHLPDLVLLDVHLHDIPGSEVLRRLRAHPMLSEVPVIALSADVSAEQVQRMEALGICAYLRKPFDLKDLQRSINEALHPAMVR